MRKLASVVLSGLILLQVPLAADGRDNQSAPRKSGNTKRVIWTIVGAGAGFAAGVFIGLNKFDDAFNSDRKVWTTAIVGAIGGGVAGALLSRPRNNAPSLGSGGFRPQNAHDRRRDATPGPLLPEQLFSSGAGERVVARFPIVLRDAPIGLDKTPLFQPLQRRIQ
jgi:4-amino-4-deoxy-L-arabinose transferase-like glycosyltransferase